MKFFGEFITTRLPAFVDSFPSPAYKSTSRWVHAPDVLGFLKSLILPMLWKTPNLLVLAGRKGRPPFSLHTSASTSTPSLHSIPQQPHHLSRGNRGLPSSLATRINREHQRVQSQHTIMGTTLVLTEADLDDEAVALVPLPPSPTIEPSTPSPLSTLTSLSSPRLPPSSTAAVQAPHSVVSSKPDDRPLTSTIPTPKSTTASDTSPPPTSLSGERPRGTPQVMDNCMFCTPETAPPVENLEWIQCNGCKRWAHTQCTGLPESIDIQTIDKFHCKRCEKTRGPTTCTLPPPPPPPFPLLFWTYSLRFE